MSIKFIDSVKLDNSLTATASAIRTLSGSSDDINFDYNGETGFRSAINDISIPQPSDSTPAVLGSAAPGSSDYYSRADHVHEKPTYSASDVGADPAVTEVTISSAGAVTQALDAGKVYEFTGALTSLTITLNATTGLALYVFSFTEGSTAFDPTLPSGVKLPANHTWKADMIYEVTILNNRASVQSWTVS